MQNSKNLDEYLTFVMNSFKLEDFKPVGRSQSVQAAYHAKIASRFKDVFKMNDAYWDLTTQPEGNNFSLIMRSYIKDNDNDNVIINFQIISEAIKFWLNQKSDLTTIPEPLTIEFRDLWINLDELDIKLKEVLKNALKKANPWIVKSNSGLKVKKCISDTARVD